MKFGLYKHFELTFVPTFPMSTFVALHLCTAFESLHDDSATIVYKQSDFLLPYGFWFAMSLLMSTLGQIIALLALSHHHVWQPDHSNDCQFF